MAEALPRRWIRRAPFDSLFEGPQAIDWEEILAHPEPLAVKTSLRRSVLRIAGADGAPGLFLKIFRARTLRERLFQLLRPSRAAWEYRMAAQLEAAGVPVAQPIAYANSMGFLPRGSYFLCEEIPNARPLSAILASRDPAPSPSRRASLLEAYGRLLGKIHRAGFYAYDLFADNVLVSDAQGPSPRLHAIDLHSTRPILGRIRWYREQNLAPALGSTEPYRGPGDEESLLRAYLAEYRGSPPASGEVERLGRHVRWWVERLRRGRFRTRTRWPLRNGERFVVERREGFGIWRRRYVEREEVLGIARAVLEAHPVPRDQRTPPAQGVWLIHGGGRSDVLGVRTSSRDVAAKLFHDRRLRSRLRTFLGFGKGKAAYVRGFGLEVRRLPGPQVLGYVERRPFGPGIFLAERLRDHEQLDRRIARILSLPDPAERRRALAILARALGSFTGRFHLRGATHLDYSARNILVEVGAPEPRFSLVDLEDLRFGGLSLGRRRRVDLQTLLDDTEHVSLRERLRFLRHYLRALGDPRRPAEFARGLARDRERSWK